MSEQNSLFGNLPSFNKASKDQNKKTVKKASQPAPKAVAQTFLIQGSQNPYAARVSSIVQVARQNLKEDDSLICIRTEDEFREYMYKLRYVEKLALDTETSGLDPIVDKMVGLCLYANGLKAAYMPMHHTDYFDNDLPDQLPDALVAEELSKLQKQKIFYHNAKFDLRVVRNSLGVYLPTPYWDTSLAGNFLNENEPHKLKYLHDKYCDGDGNVLNYSDLFEGIPFNYVPIDLGYLYAANDPKKTLELGEYQEQFLDPNSEKCIKQDLKEAAILLRYTEIPLISVLCDMEDTGIEIDSQLSTELSTKYIRMRDVAEVRCQTFIQKLDWEYISPNIQSKLDNPVNIGSPPQLAIILYDILLLKSTDKDSPRGTGEDILQGLKENYPRYKQFFEDILEYRGLEKLLSTYIDKMPGLVKKKTGRLHGQFNQYGAKTGRFSSSDPNLQNIPSKNKEIRKMFRAKSGHVLISCDYSQQEPRVLAHLCFQFGDDSMYQAYVSGRDLYAWIASEVYRVDYDHCKEKFPDGTSNPEGKKRRDAMKSVVLGLMYGRGAGAIAEQLSWTKKEAQRIVDLFFDTFPAVKKVIDYYQSLAREKGYVPTVWGRKRRLPDIQLQEYVITNADGTPAEEAVVGYYMHLLGKYFGYKAKVEIKEDIQSKGLKIVDNGGKIADAQRQVLNSIIQGSSADITKKAMLLIGNDDILKELGAKMLLTVHDEIMVEAPEQVALQVANRVQELMIQAPTDIIKLPMKVDCEITRCWYGEDVTDELKEKYAA